MKIREADLMMIFSAEWIANAKVQGYEMPWVAHYITGYGVYRAGNREWSEPWKVRIGENLRNFWMLYKNFQIVLKIKIKASHSGI